MEKAFYALPLLPITPLIKDPKEGVKRWGKFRKTAGALPADLRFSTLHTPHDP